MEVKQAVAERAQKLKDGFISLNQLVDGTTKATRTTRDPFSKPIKLAVSIALDGLAPATDLKVEVPKDTSGAKSLQERRKKYFSVRISSVLTLI